MTKVISFFLLMMTQSQVAQWAKQIINLIWSMKDMVKTYFKLYQTQIRIRIPIPIWIKTTKTIQIQTSTLDLINRMLTTITHPVMIWLPTTVSKLIIITLPVTACLIVILMKVNQILTLGNVSTVLIHWMTILTVWDEKDLLVYMTRMIVVTIRDQTRILNMIMVGIWI